MNHDGTPGALPEPVEWPEDLSWRPLEGVESEWEVAHRGRGRYLLRGGDGRLLNGLDHPWTLQECRAEIEVERALEVRTEDSETLPLLKDLHAIRRSWLRWSVDRLEETAADVLSLEEPVEVQKLSKEQIRQLIVEWEPIHERGEA